MQMTMKEMRDWLKAGGDAPEWFTEGRQTPKSHIKHVRMGLHPFGVKLTDVEGATCGNCRFHESHTRVSTYHKCALMKQTAGPGTDLRVKWRGCEKWERNE